MTYRGIAQKLRLGCEVHAWLSCGSHREWHDPATGGLTVLPDWGSKDLKLGKVRAAAGDLGIEWERFARA